MASIVEDLYKIIFDFGLQSPTLVNRMWEYIDSV